MWRAKGRNGTQFADSLLLKQLALKVLLTFHLSLQLYTKPSCKHTPFTLPRRQRCSAEQERRGAKLHSWGPHHERLPPPRCLPLPQRIVAGTRACLVVGEARYQRKQARIRKTSLPTRGPSDSFLAESSDTRCSAVRRLRAKTTQANEMKGDGERRGEEEANVSTKYPVAAETFDGESFIAIASQSRRRKCWCTAIFRFSSETLPF